MAALEQVANNQPARHPLLDDVALARIINRVHGGPVVKAWEVGGLDETWIDMFVGLTEDLPRKRARQRMIAKLHQDFEKSHPTYGKMH